MALTKIHIKEIDGIASWYQNVDCEVRIPTISDYALMIFSAVAAVFYILFPILLFPLSLISTAGRNGRNEAESIQSVICVAFPVIIVYFLLSYKKILIPIVNTWRKTRRYAVNPRKAFLDPRSPVLLLRSFIADREKNNLGEIIQRTPEEVLVEALSAAGPVITAGQPGEGGLPFLGATRVYFGEDWDKNVLALCKVANAIVIDASNSKSLAWEMLCVKNLIHPRRVLISFLSSQDTVDHKTEILVDKRSFERFYERFSVTFLNSFGGVLPTYDSNTLFLQFDEDWNPYPIKLGSNPGTNLTVDTLARGLTSFFFHLDKLNSISKK